MTFVPHRTRKKSGGAHFKGPCHKESSMRKPPRAPPPRPVSQALCSHDDQSTARAVPGHSVDLHPTAGDKRRDPSHDADNSARKTSERMLRTPWKSSTSGNSARSGKLHSKMRARVAILVFRDDVKARMLLERLLGRMTSPEPRPVTLITAYGGQHTPFTGVLQLPTTNQLSLFRSCSGTPAGFSFGR